MTDQILRELGAISATLEGLKEGQDRANDRLEKMDDRLRSVETKSAVAGGMTGAIGGVVMAVAIDMIKGAFGKG